MSRAKTPVRVAWRLRRATERDWPAILALQSAENRPHRQDSRVLDYIIALAGRELIGCVAGRCEGGTGYIYGLVVATRWRRRGIGHTLTNACLSHLRRSKAEAVFALSMFWNLGFFQKHEFVLVKRGSFPDLVALHGDFSAEWGRHSALIRARL